MSECGNLFSFCLRSHYYHYECGVLVFAAWLLSTTVDNYAAAAVSPGD